MKTAPRFARIPMEVLNDSELTHADRTVYAHLAASVFQGNIACVGQRLLAQLCHMDRRTLRERLDNIARRGHISRAIGRLSGRAVYQLNSPVFLQDCEQVGVVSRPQVGVVSRPRSRYRIQTLRRVK